MTEKTALLPTREPEIDVGIMEGVRVLKGRFNGVFRLDDGRIFSGPFAARMNTGRLILTDDSGHTLEQADRIHFRPEAGATFTLADVTIGVQFHWERKQDQTFPGELILIGAQDALIVINRVRLEDYLSSVISSEMSAEAPPAFLEAHAVTSRSWLMAMLARQDRTVERGKGMPAPSSSADEIVRWYDREDHARYDVCADDHCQRYQGLTKIMTDRAAAAVRSTRGVFLVFNGAVCDARFHKCCGGRTEPFENCWEPVRVPYLTSVVDAAVFHERIDNEAAAEAWVATRPDAYCGATDAALLQRILPDFDRETPDFFRWQVTYRRQDLEAILKEKSGIDFGQLHDIAPMERGPSGRIVRVRIDGSKRTVTVGKELEIRRWLSRSHLYSSAFCVSVERDASGLPVRFILKGAGWGHGVGLCQIGAAVMAEKGCKAEDILRHYFREAEIRKLYD